MEFNLPGLFRYCTNAAREMRKYHILILVPEVDKDEFIEDFTWTRFIQENSPIKRATIPIKFHIDELNFAIEPAELESGTIIMEFK